MRRRSVEGNHPFANLVAQECRIFDLGGLLLDANWNCTAAIEAFELKEKPQSVTGAIEASGYTELLYMNSVFAEKIGIPFFLAVHVKQSNKIHVYQLVPASYPNLTCVDSQTFSEPQFIQWWQSKKGTIQTKPYREDFQQRAHDSYFDSLLEGNGLKWGGNIDGYCLVCGPDGYEVLAVIENRFTNKTPLSCYDPNEYYHRSGGGDANTWKPLISLKDSLEVPLFLMTYSNRENETTQAGITRVLDQSATEGLVYMRDSEGNPLRPCDNIFSDVSDLKDWMLQNLD